MVTIRPYHNNDYPFLRKMLFEAVFWSRGDNKPSLEEGLSYDYTRHILTDFGTRDGDLAVIAEVDGEYAGAAFIRYWNEELNTRGYISNEIPVLAIGVEQTHRGKGIGSSLMTEIQKQAKKHHINSISLCVTKTNIAYQLYVKHGFDIVQDLGDSYNMVWRSK